MKRFAWTWPIMLAGSMLLAFGMLPDRPAMALVMAFCAGIAFDPTVEWAAKQIRREE